MKSILQKEKECFVCRAKYNLHEHHIYFGVKGREKSERHGLKVWLCREHYEGTNGVHGKNGHWLDNQLKQAGQKAFERTHAREEFISIFGRNYLD